MAATGVSVSHDGGRRACLALHDEALAGVGIDLVSLPRLRHHTPDRIVRLASRLMDEEEFAGFSTASEPEPAQRFAMHFAAMEAASKALGTGLRLYLGMGSADRPSPRDIALVRKDDGSSVRFKGKGLERAEGLGVRQATVSWRLDEDLVVCVVVLTVAAGGLALGAPVQR
jgi:holo-[acyl-carrier protein] synthase